MMYMDEGSISLFVPGLTEEIIKISWPTYTITVQTLYSISAVDKEDK